MEVTKSRKKSETKKKQFLDHFLKSKSFRKAFFSQWIDNGYGSVIATITYEKVRKRYFELFPKCDQCKGSQVILFTMLSLPFWLFCFGFSQYFINKCHKKRKKWLKCTSKQPKT